MGNKLGGFWGGMAEGVSKGADTATKLIGMQQASERGTAYSGPPEAFKVPGMGPVGGKETSPPSQPVQLPSGVTQGFDPARDSKITPPVLGELPTGGATPPNQLVIERRGRLLDDLHNIYLKHNQPDAAMALRNKVYGNIFELAKIAPGAAIRAWNANPRIVEEFGTLSPEDMKTQGDFKYLSFGKNRTGLIGWDSRTGKMVKMVKPSNDAEEKQPSIPFMIEKPLTGTTQQKFQWNPETRAHDIPIGQPHPIYKPEKPESAFKEGNEEMTLRQKVSSNVINQLRAKYGGKATYDPLMQAWTFQPGFNQGAFWGDYQRLETKALGKYGLKPIEEARTPQASNIQLPATMRTTSEAIKFLKDTHNLNDEQAKQWLRENAR